MISSPAFELLALSIFSVLDILDRKREDFESGCTNLPVEVRFFARDLNPEVRSGIASFANECGADTLPVSVKNLDGDAQRVLFYIRFVPVFVLEPPLPMSTFYIFGRVANDVSNSQHSRRRFSYLISHRKSPSL